MYARRTKVDANRTRQEIEHALDRYGATSFAYLSERGKAIVVFEASGRRIRFDLPLPEKAGDRADQERRQKWRALLLCIKAKLESVASKIETFEEAFLAHVVMPDGRTVGEHTAPRITAAYESGTMQPLLPPPAKMETRE